MNGYFVTATGTDVGKTYVTAGIIRAADDTGRTVSAIKPIMSGYDPAYAATSDAGILLGAMRKPPTAENIAAIAPWRFAAPLSPDMAAARENQTIDFAAVVAFCQSAIAAAPGLLLVEGVGGTMVPLNETHNVRSLITALGLPAILVAGTYLGTISHTLNAAETLTTHGIDLAAIVLSESAAAPATAEETAATLRRFLPITPIKIIPRHFNETSFQYLMDYLFREDRWY